MADSKHEETFKVIDRRHFTGEGDLRPEVVEQERREEEAAAKQAAAKKAASQAQAKTDAKSAASAAGAAKADKTGEIAIPKSEIGHGLEPEAPADLISEKPEGASDAGATASSRSFQMLVDFLTRNAAAMLGGMADPRTGQPFVDLEGAREVIDMLDALREKTRGNLSKEDDQLLIEVLGSLKLTFMEISKAAAEAMAKKAKGK